jgi:predicted nucleic acid-binding Zn ribbon protein
MRRLYHRNATAMPLREAIEEFLSYYRLKTRLDESKAIESWEKIVGEAVARHTESLKIRKHILFIKVDSSVVRNELMYSRKKIIDSFNRAAGSKVIEDIVLS